MCIWIEGGNRHCVLSRVPQIQLECELTFSWRGPETRVSRMHDKQRSILFFGLPWVDSARRCGLAGSAFQPPAVLLPLNKRGVEPITEGCTGRGAGLFPPPAIGPVCELVPGMESISVTDSHTRFMASLRIKFKRSSTLIMLCPWTWCTYSPQRLDYDLILK